MCGNTTILDKTEKMLLELQGTPLAFSEKDLAQTREAMQLYRQECKRCETEARNDYKCMMTAETNYERRLPQNRNTIYPYANYDWDYGNYISNNYAPRYTGVTNSGEFQDVINNTRAFSRLLGGMINDPIPNPRSVANRKDRNSDYPDINACNSNPFCTVTQQVRNGFTQAKPYHDPSGFLDKDLQGENSSSFYVQIGTCRKRDIKTRKECEDRGFTWTKSVTSMNPEDGSCEAPRYMFVDNTPKTFFNGSKMKGLIPSIANDFLSLMPDKLFAALMGQSVTGQFAVQPCEGEDGSNPSEGTTESFETLRRTDFLERSTEEMETLRFLLKWFVILTVSYFVLEYGVMRWYMRK